MNVFRYIPTGDPGILYDSAAHQNADIAYYEKVGPYGGWDLSLAHIYIPQNLQNTLVYDLITK